MSIPICSRAMSEWKCNASSNLNFANDKLSFFKEETRTDHRNIYVSNSATSEFARTLLIGLFSELIQAAVTSWNLYFTFYLY